MAIGEQTVGTVTSTFPAAIAALSAQTESSDPVSEDPDWAEGRDANAWSAEIQALEAVVGIGDQAVVSIDNSTPASPTAAIGALRIAIGSSLATIAEVAALALTDTAVNYIHLDLSVAPPAYAVTTGGWPSVATTRFVPLAIWDDSGGSPVLTDQRPQRPAPAALAGPGVLGVQAAGGKGGGLLLKVLEGTATGSGATVSAASLIPAGSILQGVEHWVETADGGGGSATGMDAGDGTTADLFFAAAALTLDANEGPGGHAISMPVEVAAATDVVFTAIGGAFDAISIRVRAHVLVPVVATS